VEQSSRTSPLRQLALQEQHEALGARFADFAGWNMPLQYEGITAEHLAVREQVGVFDVSHLGRAWMNGPAAGAALRSITTFDVTALPVGKAHYSLYCNDFGGIDDDVFIYHLPNERWLIVHNAACAEADFARVLSVDAEACEVTAETVMLAVQGPGAMALLENVLGPSLVGLEPRSCIETTWQGAQVLFARTGYTGEDGGECIIGAEHAAKLWEALLGGGAAPVGLGARDTLRLEAALPLHGNDIDATTNPFEAGLGFAVSLGDTAQFVGREALADLKEHPSGRRLAHLVAKGRGVPRAGQNISTPDGEPVGVLTSGGHSPSRRIGIGMAYLPAELAEPGVDLQVDVRGRVLQVEVVRRPFYRKPRQ